MPNELDSPLKRSSFPTIEKQLLYQAEQERQANVIRAEGEAESADMIAKAIERAGDGLIKIRSIEASKEVSVLLPGGETNG